MLDPLARHDFMAAVMAAAAEDGVSVVLSSHALAELERVADYLILLSGGRVQVAGEVDDLLACHRVLTGPAAEADECAARLRVVHARRAQAQAHLLVRTGGRAPLRRPGAAWMGGAPGRPGRTRPGLPARTRRRGAAGPGTRPRCRGGDQMTALTVPARQDRDLRPVPWRKMVWVTWRQHRIALAGVAALLGGGAVYLLIMGLSIHHAYAAATACHPWTSDACGNLVGNFLSTYWGGAQITSVLLQLVPVLIGVGPGAPVLARELETGTFRFIWTQGFGGPAGRRPS